MSSVPKPKPRPKRVKPRKVRKPIARTKRPNPVNRKRKASAFTLHFHSKARVEFVRERPCVLCGGGPSDNAHIPSQSGMGLRGNYTLIVPLCRRCHQDMDDHPVRWYNLWWISRAEEVESAWQRSTRNTTP